MARHEAQAAVSGLCTHCFGCDKLSFGFFVHLVTGRFHSAEYLDALSFLPKDAEKQRRQARRAANHAD
jgi:hypothetical protein